MNTQQMLQSERYVSKKEILTPEENCKSQLLTLGSIGGGLFSWPFDDMRPAYPARPTIIDGQPNFASCSYSSQESPAAVRREADVQGRLPRTSDG